MYICPICKREFNSKELVSKHYLKCWNENHLYHQAKFAPRSKDISTREINDDVLNFFNSFKKG